MGNSKELLLCREAVPISECPLSQVPLYTVTAGSEVCTSSACTIYMYVYIVHTGTYTKARHACNYRIRGHVVKGLLQYTI